MEGSQVARIRPWFGDPPRADPPDVPGYALASHARVDLLQLSIVGVILLPLWWFVFAGITQIITGRPLSITFGLTQLLLGVVLALVAVPVLHELVHGLTARLLGAHPSYGVGPGYAYTTFREPMGSYRYMAVGLAPLVLLSALGMVSIALWPEARGWLVFACIVNAAGAIGDLWMAWTIARLPRRSIFFDLADGFATYLPESEISPQPASQPAGEPG